MEKDDDIKDGDMIVTSNISGKFLPGILVGYADGHHGGLQRQPDEIGIPDPCREIRQTSGGSGYYRLKGCGAGDQ